MLQFYDNGGKILSIGKGETMNIKLPNHVYERFDLRNRIRVFRDRVQAGEILADMLRDYQNSNALMLGIPAGGVPVAAVIAKRLHLPLDVAVVSKITLPWNTEAGYGAVAFDGTVCLNEPLLSRLGLNEQEVQQGIAKTQAKVMRRLEQLRGSRSFPVLPGRLVILVDDGLASGFTLRAACEALSKGAVHRLIIAVPTGHWESVQAIAAEVEALYCPNIRQGWSFAVADAYEYWSDVGEEEIGGYLGSTLAVKM